jgi:hypothetical protein
MTTLLHHDHLLEHGDDQRVALLAHARRVARIDLAAHRHALDGHPVVHDRRLDVRDALADLLVQPHATGGDRLAADLQLLVHDGNPLAGLDRLQGDASGTLEPREWVQRVFPGRAVRRHDRTRLSPPGQRAITLRAPQADGGRQDGRGADNDERREEDSGP